MKKTVLFGAGRIGVAACERMRSQGIDVAFFVDNNEAKWGAECGGLKIYPPKQLLGEDKSIEIVVAMHAGQSQKSVIMQLNEMGFVYGENVAAYDDMAFMHIELLTEPFGPGFVTLNEGYSLLKPITNSVLVTDGSPNYIFRVIESKNSKHMREVFDKIDSNAKLRNFIVPTSIAENECVRDKLALTFKHERIAPVSYAPEWSPTMFKDYCLFMIDFIAALDESDLGLWDPSAFNAAFSKGKFVYFDICGIYAGKTSVSVLQKFIELHINPLILTVKQPYKGNTLIRHPLLLTKFSDFSEYLSDGERERYTDLNNKSCKALMGGHVARCCKLLKELIDFASSLSNANLSGFFVNYQDGSYRGLKDSSKWTLKQKTVVSLINQANPRTVLDLAGNAGWYCMAVAHDVDYAIASDLEADASDKAFGWVKELGLTNVLPVCFDLITPLPAIFRNNFISSDAITPHKKSAIDRLKCDMVLALAIIHHLALSQGLTFDEIISQLLCFSKRYLIVEFVDRDDFAVSEMIVNRGDFRTNWYTKEGFESVLASKCHIIKSLPSTDTRVLYLCERVGK